MEMEGNIKSVITYWMEGEINTFIKVWLSAYISLSYCYFAAKILSNVVARLAAFLPVLSLFLFLPLQLHSLHLGGTTAFFLAWLAVFKLLMFASGKGPLSVHGNSLPRFVAVACLPIKLQSREEIGKKRKGSKSIFNHAVKALLFALILKVYDYSDCIHPKILMVVYGFHMYLCLEMMLAIAAALARGCLGAELEPQFDEPYLASSLQDFWGRRWNLMVTRILRPTVYLPVLDWSSRVVGREWASLPAVMSTFLVSGLVHELILYYLVRARPTWEITCFFLLQGACLMAEIGVKKAVNGRWQLPKIVGIVLTVGFVMLTSFWLFFPQLLQCNGVEQGLLRCKGVEQGLAELTAVGTFAKDLAWAIKLTVNS